MLISWRNVGKHVLVEGVLNTNIMAYFTHKKINISAANKLGGWCMGMNQKKEIKTSNLVRFDVFLQTILAPPPQTSFFPPYMGPPSGQVLNVLYMGAPSDLLNLIDVIDT